MRDRLDASWTFEEAVKRISENWSATGHIGPVRRLALIKSWGALVGRDRAVREFDEAINRHGSITGAARNLRFSRSTLKELRAHFESVDALGVGPGLVVYFGATLRPLERVLVEATVFAVLGRDTSCELVEMRQVDGGAILRFANASSNDLELLGDALWSRGWEGRDIAQQRDNALQPADIFSSTVVPMLEKIWEALERIELRSPSADAVEMLDDQGRQHVLDKDRKLLRTWPQKLVNAGAKAAIKKVVGIASDELKDELLPGKK